MVAHLAATFIVNQCDGLFLPAIDHLGIQLPIRDIVRRIEQVAELRFVFIDASQAFCQVPIAECFDVADFVVAGSHKWLGAYLPTGIGFYGRRRSRGLIERRLHHVRRSARTSDPLLDFTEQLESHDLDSHFETANLTSLFACAGATSEQLSSQGNGHSPREIPTSRPWAMIPRPGDQWCPLQPHVSLRSQIVLFESPNLTAEQTSPDAIRRAWLDRGCIVTGYPDGRARISLPR